MSLSRGQACCFYPTQGPKPHPGQRADSRPVAGRMELLDHPRCHRQRISCPFPARPCHLGAKCAVAICHCRPSWQATGGRLRAIYPGLGKRAAGAARRMMIHLLHGWTALFPTRKNPKKKNEGRHLQGRRQILGRKQIT